MPGSKWSPLLEWIFDDACPGETNRTVTVSVMSDKDGDTCRDLEHFSMQNIEGFCSVQSQRWSLKQWFCNVVVWLIMLKGLNSLNLLAEANRICNEISGYLAEFTMLSIFASSPEPEIIKLPQRISVQNNAFPYSQYHLVIKVMVSPKSFSKILIWS